MQNGWNCQNILAIIILADIKLLLFRSLSLVNLGFYSLYFLFVYVVVFLNHISIHIF